MPIPVASRSSDLATAEPSEWPTRIGDLHRCDEREYVPQNALVTDPNAVSLNAGSVTPFGTLELVSFQRCPHRLGCFRLRMVDPEPPLCRLARLRTGVAAELIQPVLQTDG
jgi:hypothetical protein